MAAVPIYTSIYVNNFSISADGQSINVSVETGVGHVITSCKFWTDATFKGSSYIDLSDKLTGGGNVYTFTISAEDVSVSSFYDGIFFAEFNTSQSTVPSCGTCVTDLAVATKLVAGKLCLLEQVLNLNICDNHNQGCQCVQTCEILALDNLMDSMVIALEFGFYYEAIDLLGSIRKLCPGCSECLDVSDINLSSGLGYGTLDNNFVLS
tara:strand:- start:4130 stop:4753 length:624 start_codon:yes stop_codon:yes gene_type:complete